MKKIQILIAFLLVSSFLFSQITYVNLEAEGNNDGSSWENAYTDLRIALQNTTEGEVWIAEGTYLPTLEDNQNTPDNNQLLSFTPSTNVSIFGGFKKTGSPKWEDRDSRRYRTILSGNINESTDRDNTFHVISLNGNITFNNLFDGLVIKDGNAPYSGGGVSISGSSNNTSVATFRNCVFEDNFADYEGGAISSNWITLRLENCTFEDNYADYEGGAVSFFSNHGPTRAAQLYVVNCIFENNLAGYSGGAIEGRGINRVVGSLFMENYAKHEGGAINHFKEDSLLITNCTFVRNISEQEGEAISNFGWDSTFTFINNSVFFDNELFLNEMFDFSGAGVHASITHSFIDTNDCPSGIDCGEGMIFDKISPFTNYFSDNLSPKENSPLINAGKNEYLFPMPETDLEGKARIYDGQVDIGAYESEFSSLTSTNELSKSDFSIFPNPSFDGHINIQLPDGEYQILVGDLKGSIVFTQQVTAINENITLQLDGLQAGLYMVQLKNKKYTATEKIQIQQQ